MWYRAGETAGCKAEHEEVSRQHLGTQRPKTCSRRLGLPLYSPYTSVWFYVADSITPNLSCMLILGAKPVWPGCRHLYEAFRPHLQSSEMIWASATPQRGQVLTGVKSALTGYKPCSLSVRCTILLRQPKAGTAKFIASCGHDNDNLCFAPTCGRRIVGHI